MDSTTQTPSLSVTARPALGGRLVTAHVLAAALALLDLITPSLMPADGEFSPGTGGILTLATLGLLTLVGIGGHLRSRRRAWLRVVAATRTVSALTAVPAFVVDGVPPLNVLGAAACVLATIVAVVLLLGPTKSAPGR